MPEVGTRFHPELTGRGNIYFNSAIPGMKKREIDAKFEEIVRFAEIDQFPDTPMKHYSSGIYVRLAFAVAAHMDLGSCWWMRRWLWRMQVSEGRPWRRKFIRKK